MTTDTAKCNPKWEPDCQGKWDYDCGIVHLSCRYYPRGGGYDILNTATGKFQGNESRPDIGPLAVCSILVGDTDSGSYVEVAKARFDGETEGEVKGKVEAWAKTMTRFVISSIQSAFRR